MNKIVLFRESESFVLWNFLCMNLKVEPYNSFIGKQRNLENKYYVDAGNW